MSEAKRGMSQMTLITGDERRRRWSKEDSGRILAAINEPGAVIADVAGREDVCTSLVYKWRKEARRSVNSPGFARVIVTGQAPELPYFAVNRIWDGELSCNSMKYGSSSTSNDSMPRIIGCFESLISTRNRMIGDVSKKAAEQRTMFCLHRTSLPCAVHTLRASTTGAMQRQPMSAALQPTADYVALGCIGIGSGNICDQQAAHRQPFGNIRKVITDRRRGVLFHQ
jgi:Transposase